jgi:hypothetical protein
MSDVRDWNRVRNWNAQIIEEFRANEGLLGGHFEGAPSCSCTRSERRAALSG